MSEKRKKKMVGKQSVAFENPPYILAAASVVGKKEGEGPLGKWFDVIEQDSMFGANTWEEGESNMIKQTITLAIKKANLCKEDINYLVGGDLLGQLIASSFGVEQLDIPLFGVYGACSTMGESLAIASILVDGGYASKVLAFTSSHFAGAEKQFRFPLSYGNQRPYSATWTVTGSGAIILGEGCKKNKGKGPESEAKKTEECTNVIPPAGAETKVEFGGSSSDEGCGCGTEKKSQSSEDCGCSTEKEFQSNGECKCASDSSQGGSSKKGKGIQVEEADVVITGITVGKVVDYGIKDSMNMGAAMAPAAMETIYQNLTDFNRQPDYYDKIVTGDLGTVGKDILIDLLKQKGIDISKVHMDCGIEMFDNETQDTHAGGSGCGCSATTLCGYILKKMRSREWNHILFVPTGALLSTVSFNEGDPVPGIAHGICLETRD